MQIDVFPHPVNDNFDMNSFVWHYTDMFVRHGLTIERTKPNVFDRTKWHVTKKGQSMSISEDDKKALVLVLEYFHCTLDDNPDYGIDKLGEALGAFYLKHAYLTPGISEEERDRQFTELMLLSRVQRVYDGNGDLVYENKILKKSYGDIYIFPSDKRLAKYTKDEEEMEHLRQMLGPVR